MGVPMKYNGEIEFYIEEVNEKHAISRMPVKSGMLNPFGTVHAGAIIWLADVTATVLALGSESIPEDGKGFPLAINLYSSLLSNQRSGEIRAEASFVRKGKQVSVVRTKVTGNNEQLLAEVTTTHIPVK
ncbi:MAG: PaaI family thioesterase [Deltaproteobacteria bacterium]|nr:PaaI family thioesterase [Deltaproteobacteria bacterium]